MWIAKNQMHLNLIRTYRSYKKMWIIIEINGFSKIILEIACSQQFSFFFIKDFYFKGELCFRFGVIRIFIPFNGFIWKHNRKLIFEHISSSTTFFNIFYLFQFLLIIMQFAQTFSHLILFKIYIAILDVHKFRRRRICWDDLHFNQKCTFFSQMYGIHNTLIIFYQYLHNIFLICTLLLLFHWLLSFLNFKLVVRFFITYWQPILLLLLR